MKSNKLALVILIFILTVCWFTFVPSTGWARLLWNLGGYLGLYLTYRLAKLKPGDIGLASKDFTKGVKYGGFVILIIGLILSFVFVVNNTIFKDQRYHHDFFTALFAVLILLPLKTVIFEEIAFRGLMPALLQSLGTRQKIIALISSFAFGIWHIPSALSVDAHYIGNNSVPVGLMMGGVVLFTSIAGLFLYELRRRSKSLMASILVHWFVNGFAILLAALSWR